MSKSAITKAQIVILLIFIAVVVAAAGAVFYPLSLPEPQDNLTIGAILPFAGTEADIGVEEQRAIELALEDAGGCIRVIYEDGSGDKAKGINAFQKLITTDDAEIIITCQSWTSNAVYPLAVNESMVQACIASAVFARTLEEDRAVCFTVGLADEAEVLSEYLLQFNRIAIMYMNNDYGRGWKDQLGTIFGSKIVAAESYNLDETDFGAQLAEIKAAEPDVLVLFSTWEAGMIVRQARDLGIDAKLASTRPIERPALLQEPAVEGLVYTYPAYNLEHPFVARYVAEYGAQPTVFAAEAYDTAVTLIQAIEECGGDTACIHDWYVNREYNGALGHVRFDEQCNAHYPLILKQVRNGVFVPYEPESL
ncbi:MAG TPA: ABC transporter substrate-binding protein [Desulfobacteria bacterium]|nr:ABC transporter substrate-binding protein [Desulfobacteria bacterium]